MKNILITIFGKLLALLGFTAIGTSCDGLIRLEYGTPYTRFEISGKIVDKDTKEPVSGIVIVYGKEYSRIDEEGNEVKEFYSEGSYVADYNEFWMHGNMYVPDNPQQLILKLSDYDSKMNGHYKDTTYTIDLQYLREPDPEDHWNSGIYGAEIVLEMEKAE